MRKFNLSFSGIRRCSYPQISTFICLSSFNNRRLCHKHHIIIPLLIVGSNKIALIVWLNNFTSKVVSLSYFDCVFLSPFSKTAPSSTPFSRSVWKKVYRDWDYHWAVVLVQMECGRFQHQRTRVRIRPSPVLTERTYLLLNGKIREKEAGNGPFEKELLYPNYNVYSV